MTISEFNTQPLSKRWETLWSWGYLMVKRDQVACTAALFSVNGFFAVILLSKEENKVLSINAYRLEDLPVEYYQLINHDRPFVRAAKPKEALMEALCAA